MHVRVKQVNNVAVTARNEVVNYNELNEVQIGLLRMFSRPMTVEQTLNIKRVIVNHLSDELEVETEKVVNQKGTSEKDFEKLRKQHQGTFFVA